MTDSNDTEQEIERLKRRLAELEARQTASVSQQGSGAAAHSGGTALGQGAVLIGGNVVGDISTGQIIHNAARSGAGKMNPR